MIQVSYCNKIKKHWKSIVQSKNYKQKTHKCLTECVTPHISTAIFGSWTLKTLTFWCTALTFFFFDFVLVNASLILSIAKLLFWSIKRMSLLSWYASPLLSSSLFVVTGAKLWLFLPRQNKSYSLDHCIAVWWTHQNYIIHNGIKSSFLSIVRVL